jgi:hypothetical protein
VELVGDKFNMGVLAFCHCDKAYENINLKGRKIYFGFWFQRFQSLLLVPVAFGPVVRQNIMAGV